jgi:hypothetical protein
LSGSSTTVNLLSTREANVLLEELKPGLRMDGLIPAEVETVVYVHRHGIDAFDVGNGLAQVSLEWGRR